jgi:hypothetical protein
LLTGASSLPSLVTPAPLPFKHPRSSRRPPPVGNCAHLVFVSLSLCFMSKSGSSKAKAKKAAKAKEGKKTAPFRRDAPPHLARPRPLSQRNLRAQQPQLPPAELDLQPLPPGVSLQPADIVLLSSDGITLLTRKAHLQSASKKLNSLIHQQVGPGANPKLLMGLPVLKMKADTGLDLLAMLGQLDSARHPAPIRQDKVGLNHYISSVASPPTFFSTSRRVLRFFIGDSNRADMSVSSSRLASTRLPPSTVSPPFSP